jgi:hypothetical protein
MKLQAIYGVIGSIKAKGASSKVRFLFTFIKYYFFLMIFFSKLVAEMILRMRRESNMDESKVPDIDELILIDRQVDMVTPMCTQLTYEGLVDEFYKIQFGM